MTIFTLFCVFVERKFYNCKYLYIQGVWEKKRDLCHRNSISIWNQTSHVFPFKIFSLKCDTLFHSFLPCIYESQEWFFWNLLQFCGHSCTSPTWLLLMTSFGFENRKMARSQIVVLAVGCCFWPNTAACLGPYKTDHYHDEGSKICFSTFLAFLFRLLGANVAIFFRTQAGWLCNLVAGTRSDQHPLNQRTQSAWPWYSTSIS